MITHAKFITWWVWAPWQYFIISRIWGFCARRPDTMHWFKWRLVRKCTQ